MAACRCAGINYPIGGVGRIAESLEEGLQERGGFVEYKANVQEILMEPKDSHSNGSPSKAVGVRLGDGRVYRGKTIVSNATRLVWDHQRSVFLRVSCCAL